LGENIDCTRSNTMLLCRRRQRKRGKMSLINQARQWDLGMKKPPEGYCGGEKKAGGCGAGRKACWAEKFEVEA